MRRGKPETPGEKFGYYVLGPIGIVLAVALVGSIPGAVIAWIWFGH